MRDIYHIYSHANGKDLIFREDENYQLSNVEYDCMDLE